MHELALTITASVLIYIASGCPDGTAALLGRIEDFEFEERIPASIILEIDEDGCAQACVKDPKCLQANYQEGLCRMFADRANVTRAIIKKGIILSRVCTEPVVAKRCTLELYPEKLLMAQSFNTLDVAGLGECLTRCFHAKQEHGNQCHSASYFPQYRSKNCILNLRSGHAEGSLLIDIFDEPGLLHIEPKC